jgi:hypothetical protein
LENGAIEKFACRIMWGLIAGFFVTIWIAAVMFKSNDILKKQTALKV